MRTLVTLLAALLLALPATLANIASVPVTQNVLSVDVTTGALAYDDQGAELTTVQVHGLTPTVAYVLIDPWSPAGVEAKAAGDGTATFDAQVLVEGTYRLLGSDDSTRTFTYPSNTNASPSTPCLGSIKVGALSTAYASSTGYCGISPSVNDPCAHTDRCKVPPVQNPCENSNLCHNPCDNGDACNPDVCQRVHCEVCPGGGTACLTDKAPCGSAGKPSCQDYACNQQALQGCKVEPCSGGGTACLTDPITGLTPCGTKDKPSCQDYACSRPGLQGCKVEPCSGGGTACLTDPVVGLAPCGTKDKQSCPDYVCSRSTALQGCDPDLPRLCTGGTVGVEPDCHDVPRLCTGSTVGIEPKCQDVPRLCASGSVGIEPDCHPVSGCDPGQVGASVDGTAVCVENPAPCPPGTTGAAGACHTVSGCDGGNVGLRVDGNNVFCQATPPPCPPGSTGAAGQCHTLSPCNEGNDFGFAVDGSGTGCVDAGVSPCNLAGASRSCQMDTDPDFQVMRQALPDAEDAQTLAAIAAAPKCQATPTLRFHAGLGVNFQGLLLSCPDYSQLIPATTPPPGVNDLPQPPGGPGTGDVPETPTVPIDTHYIGDVRTHRQSASASSTAYDDCSTNTAGPQRPRLWYTVYVDDYFYEDSHEDGGYPVDPADYVSDIHAFWTTRSDGRWQTHASQPDVPTCPRWILPMPHGAGPSQVRTESELLRLRDFEAGFSDAGQIVVAMGVGEIQYDEIDGSAPSSFGITIGEGTDQPSVADNRPVVYFDGADTTWFSDRLFAHEMGHAFGLTHTPCEEGMAGHGGKPWIHLMAFSSARDNSCKAFEMDPDNHWHWIFKGPDSLDVNEAYAGWCNKVGAGSLCT